MRSNFHLLNHFGEFFTFRIILVRFHEITFFTLRIHFGSDFRTFRTITNYFIWGIQSPSEPSWQLSHRIDKDKAGKHLLPWLKPSKECLGCINAFTF
jgi:hypothetical protein